MVHVVVSLILLYTLTFVNCDTITVDSESGRIVGEEVHFSHKDVDKKNTIKVFQGIPYAVPPIGELRFKPPLPVIPWTGDYNATYLRPACIQAESPMIPLNEPTDEDCLHLNIYAPKSADKAAVMVWIHGGGFVLGSGSNVYYDGIPLAAIYDVIVVGINYRLGVLGFLTTGDDVIPGNYGLLDQLEALKWIKTNIENFGGDPDKITIFGESAGSISVNLHILSPMSDGLFQRAIMQSGVSAATFTHKDKEIITKLAHGVGEIVGCKSDTSYALLQCLRDVTPADRFLDSQDLTTGKLEKVTGLKGLHFPFLPVTDGHFIVNDPTETINDQRITAMDVMMGSMANENIMSLLVVYPDAMNWTSVTMDRQKFEEILPTFSSVSQLSEGPLIVEAVKLLYTDWYAIDTPEENYTSAFVNIFSDETIVCPTNTLAHAMSESGSNVYLYQMSYSASRSMWGFEWSKAAHGDDLQFVFGWHFRSQNDWQTSPEDVDVSLQVMKYWTNFAKTGDPNLADNDMLLIFSPEDFRVEWPTFSAKDPQYKDISLEMTTRTNLKARECAFWTKYLPTLLKYTRENPCDNAEVDAHKKYTEKGNIP